MKLGLCACFVSVWPCLNACTAQRQPLYEQTPNCKSDTVIQGSSTDSRRLTGMYTSASLQLSGASLSCRS